MYYFARASKKFTEYLMLGRYVLIDYLNNNHFKIEYDGTLLS